MKQTTTESRMTQRSSLIDPISQLRFALVLGCITLGAVCAAFAVECLILIGPASRDLRQASESGQKGSVALTRLLEISVNPQLPADQRISMARTEGLDLASSLAESSRLTGSAAGLLGNPMGFAAGLAAAALFTCACGLLWSRRITGAEHGLVRRLEAIVDGNLSLDVPCGPYPDLHIMQRGMRRALDEVRSVTRREIQLMNEVGDSVQSICTAVSNDPNLSPASRAQLLAAAEKIVELRRIADRPRW